MKEALSRGRRRRAVPTMMIDADTAASTPSKLRFEGAEFFAELLEFGAEDGDFGGEGFDGGGGGLDGSGGGGFVQPVGLNVAQG